MPITTMNTVKTKEPAMIAVMGATGSGKSTFINLASGSQLATGSGLESCTSAVQRTPPFNFEKRSVVLVDTPGFDDTNKSDTEVLSLIAAFDDPKYPTPQTSPRKPTLAGIIYIHRISDNRVGGTSRKNFKMFRKLCGSDNMKNVVLVTNMWGTIPQDQAEKRETELATSDKFFAPVLSEGAQFLRHTNTKESASVILRRIVYNRPFVARIQQEMVVEKSSLGQTAAGAESNREFLVMEARHRRDLKDLREGLVQAMVERDEKARREHQEEIMELTSKMNRLSNYNQAMQSMYEEERERIRVLKSEMEWDDWTRRNEAFKLNKKIEDMKRQKELDEIYYQHQLERAVSQGKQLGVQETEARYKSILESQEERERVYQHIKNFQGRR